MHDAGSNLTVCLTSGAVGDDGDLAAGAAAWARCEALTAGLAGELAEQLRLILEPTVASRLAGNFRSGESVHQKQEKRPCATSTTEQLVLTRSSPGAHRSQPPCWRSSDFRSG